MIFKIFFVKCVFRCSIKKPDDCDRKDVEDHQEDCDNERDSANHSPVDNILDSQSVQFSDAHSEVSVIFLVWNSRSKQA